MRKTIIIILVIIVAVMAVFYYGGFRDRLSSNGETLAGIDADNDGVRDDIQRYIAVTYPDSEKTRAALKLMAKRIQAVILTSNNEVESIKASYQEQDALYCIVAVVGSDKAFDIDEELTAEMLNTGARYKAYSKAGQHFSGQSSWGPDGNYRTYTITVQDAAVADYQNYKGECDFDPDSLPN